MSRYSKLEILDFGGVKPAGKGDSTESHPGQVISLYQDRDGWFVKFFVDQKAICLNVPEDLLLQQFGGGHANVDSAIAAIRLNATQATPFISFVEQTLSYLSDIQLQQAGFSNYLAEANSRYFSGNIAASLTKLKISAPKAQGILQSPSVLLFSSNDVSAAKVLLDKYEKAKGKSGLFYFAYYNGDKTKFILHWVLEGKIVKVPGGTGDAEHLVELDAGVDQHKQLLVHVKDLAVKFEVERRAAMADEIKKFGETLRSYAANRPKSQDGDYVLMLLSQYQDYLVQVYSKEMMQQGRVINSLTTKNIEFSSQLEKATRELHQAQMSLLEANQELLKEKQKVLEVQTLETGVKQQAEAELREMQAQLKIKEAELLASKKELEGVKQELDEVLELDNVSLVERPEMANLSIATHTTAKTNGTNRTSATARTSGVTDLIDKIKHALSPYAAYIVVSLIDKVLHKKIQQAEELQFVSQLVVNILKIPFSDPAQVKKLLQSAEGAQFSASHQVLRVSLDPAMQKENMVSETDASRYAANHDSFKYYKYASTFASTLRKSVSDSEAKAILERGAAELKSLSA